MTPRSRAAAAICGALLVTACDGWRARADRRAVDRQAEAYVRLALALGERDSDSLDFYAGPPAWAADANATHISLADIKSSASALVTEVASTISRAADSDARRRFLRRQLEAIVARVDLLAGRRFTFDEESRLLFGVGVPDVDRASVERTRAELDRVLPAGSSLGRRYADFDRRFLIPIDRVPLVMARALDGCRRATLAHLALPAGEGVTVEYVAEMPWSAFTRYEGHGHSRIRINRSLALTVDRALELACHEAYPGHHTINVIVDDKLATAERRLELTVLPLFSPRSLTLEAAATFAPELAFSDAERLRFEADDLFPAAGLDSAAAARYLRVERLVDSLRMLEADIARRYLDGDLEFVRAAVALEDEALMPSAEATLKFLNEFRSYAVTYTVGRDLVARFVAERAPAGGDAALRWRAYGQWLTAE